MGLSSAATQSKDMTPSGLLGLTILLAFDVPSFEDAICLSSMRSIRSASFASVISYVFC